jgi:sphinganine-1-phosphate aldolase
VVNTTMQSTKSGGPMASAWATLQFIGDEGYLERADRAMKATDRIVEGLEAIPELKVMVKPDIPVIAFTSDEIDVFHLADELKVRGWLVGAQLAYGSSKENIHLTVAQNHLEIVDDLMRDVRASVEAARGKGPPPIVAQIAPMFAQSGAMPGDDMLGQMLAMAGISGTALPERMAEINHVLNVLPAPLKERLLIEFVNDLFVA